MLPQALVTKKRQSLISLVHRRIWTCMSTVHVHVLYYLISCMFSSCIYYVYYCVFRIVHDNDIMKISDD